MALLVQIDKLVQLIESPVFTCQFYHNVPCNGGLTWNAWNLISDLRLQLLEPEKYPYLFKCLYGLLMLLPQSSAFVSLRNRLNAVNSSGFLHIAPKSSYDSRFSRLGPLINSWVQDRRDYFLHSVEVGQGRHQVARTPSALPFCPGKARKSEETEPRSGILATLGTLGK